MKKFISTKMKIFLLILFLLSVGCYTFAAINLYYSNYSLSSYFSNINDWNFGWTDNENYLSGNMEKEFPETTENININTTSSNISISPYEGTTIKVDIHGRFSANYSYSDCIKRFDVTEHDINIETTTENFFNNTFLNISIPRNFKGNINIKTISGDISVSSLTLSNLSLATTSGDIESYNVNSANSNISTLSGETNYTGSLGECNITSISGDIALNLSDLGANSTITSTSGSIDISLASALGYTANITSTSGDIDVRDHNTDNLSINKNFSFTNGDGSKNIAINTTSGDISIY